MANTTTARRCWQRVQGEAWGSQLQPIPRSQRPRREGQRGASPRQEQEARAFSSRAERDGDQIEDMIPTQQYQATREGWQLLGAMVMDDTSGRVSLRDRLDFVYNIDLDEHTTLFETGQILFT